MGFFSCCGFDSSGKHLFAGTDNGEVLVWDVSKFWTASYWINEESEKDNRLPKFRLKVMRSAIIRLIVVEDKLIVCGKDGMFVFAIAHIWSDNSFPLVSINPSASQKSFNALVYDNIVKCLYLGCEDGSVVVVESLEETNCESVFEGDVEEGVAVLDLDIMSSFLFIACSNATVLCFDLEKRKVVWRINLVKGEAEKGDDLSEIKVVAAPSSVRCTNVKVDPSQKWLLCGCGGNLANNEGGFFSLWHIEAREAVSIMPIRGCPSACGWIHGEVVVCGAESSLYQYSMKGVLSAHNTIQNITQASDVAVYQHPDDLVGAIIAISGDSIVLQNGVGRIPILLKERDDSLF